MTEASVHCVFSLMDPFAIFRDEKSVQAWVPLAILAQAQGHFSQGDVAFARSLVCFGQFPFASL